jgi:hypothetical protein
LLIASLGKKSNKPKTFFMKQQLFKKSIAWMGTYIVTSLLTAISFAFLASEWETIFNVSKAIYELTRPFAAQWIEVI